MNAQAININSFLFRENVKVSKTLPTDSVVVTHPLKNTRLYDTFIDFSTNGDRVARLRVEENKIGLGTKNPEPAVFNFDFELKFLTKNKAKAESNEAKEFVQALNYVISGLRNGTIEATWQDKPVPFNLLDKLMLFKTQFESWLSSQFKTSGVLKLLNTIHELFNSIFSAETLSVFWIFLKEELAKTRTPYLLKFSKDDCEFHEKAPTKTIDLAIDFIKMEAILNMQPATVPALQWFLQKIQKIGADIRKDEAEVLEGDAPPKGTLGS